MSAWVDPQWLAILPADALWILVALVLGLIAKWVNVPPMVGFLAGGFLLNAAGQVPTAFVESAADVGVTLLLFTIGLHLSLSVFTRPEVWGVASANLVLFTACITGVLYLGVVVGLGPLAGLSFWSTASLGLALAFCSTVFTAKMLEARGSRGSRHGRVAMGVLIIQDVVAVIFLAVVGLEHRPSPWMLALVLLPLARRPLRYIMQFCGHGELLVLYGVLCAIGGASLFEAVGLHADLGALAFGLLLAGSAKSDELGAKLDGFKDLFLAGFFVSVGLSAPLEPSGLVLGVLLLFALPLKTLGFYVMFSLARLRSRTSWQAALDLATFSEFGLILVAMEVEVGLMPEGMLATVAVAVAGSLFVASPFALNGDHLFTRLGEPLSRLQRPNRLPGDEDLHLRPLKVVVFGLGRLGSAVLATVEAEYPGRVLGVDVNEWVVQEKRKAGLNAVMGDATESEFWWRTGGMLEDLDWVLLSMSAQEANLSAIDQLRTRGYTGRIAATSRYPDQADELRQKGATTVFDVYTEAGAGFAKDLHRRLQGYETGVLDIDEVWREQKRRDDLEQ